MAAGARRRAIGLSLALAPEPGYLFTVVDGRFAAGPLLRLGGDLAITAMGMVAAGLIGLASTNCVQCSMV